MPHSVPRNLDLPRNKILLLAFSSSLCALATMGAAAAAQYAAMAKNQNPLAYASAVAIDGLLYVIGGQSPGGAETAAFAAFDPTKNAWTPLLDMPGGRYLAEAGSVNGLLYVVGGWTRNPPYPYSTLFIYDPAAGKWTTGPGLSHLSGCGTAAGINGKLYVTTPCNGYAGWTKLLDLYDPATDGWTSLAPSSAAHAEGASGVINGELYLASGTDGTGTATNVVEDYDPATDQWTSLAPIPTPVDGPASLVFNGRLFVIGGAIYPHPGNPRQRQIAEVQIYDPIKNGWPISSTPLPAARSQAAADLVYGIGFIEGGYRSGNYLDSNLSMAVAPSIP